MGDVDGISVGLIVGLSEGAQLGDIDGNLEGDIEGFKVGTDRYLTNVGCAVVLADGTPTFSARRLFEDSLRCVLGPLLGEIKKL